MTGRYRLVDHTADFGLEIFGNDARTLFETAAMAMFDQLSTPAASEGEHQRTIDVTGDDWPDLMVNWLRELLYMFNGEQQVLCKVSVTSIEQTRLTAMILYADYLPHRHGIRNEIKAVTYHQADAGPCEGQWRARIIFDV